MRKNIKNLLIFLLGVFRVYPVRCSSKKELLKLIESLHPVKVKEGLIRFGPNRDGGYLIPKQLDDVDACFSAGVGNESGFELDCVNRNMDVYMLDGSVDAPASSNEKFVFMKKYLGISDYGDHITLETWINSYDIKKYSDMMLQMDIDGAEWGVLLQLDKELLNKFKIVIIEFHDLYNIFSSFGFDIIRKVFYKLLSTHVCVHIHPNNCISPIRKWGIEVPSLMEFTFIRRENNVQYEYVSDYPNKYDYDNTDGERVVLPDIWHR